MAEKQTVLVLCTGNSARSQMAEGFFRHLGGGRYEVSSAGTHPRGVHPRTVEVMREVGIDIAAHASTHVDTYRNRGFDLVITVCDRARDACPVFPGARVLHWSFEDPAAEEGEAQLARFRQVRDQIGGRISAFLDSDR